jgi:polysaccharide biosynthesis protein PelC
MTLPSRPRHLLRPLKVMTLALLLTALAACSTVDRGKAPALQANADWTVLPFANHTETPMAGSRAESVAEALLHARGVGRIKRYTSGAQAESLFDAADAKRQEQAMAWAREQGVRYALGGTVDEWRYKVGVDGEPAAGLTLQIIDVQSGEILWSGAGGKSGWSREALSAVAQKLIRELLNAGLSGAR